MIGCLTFVVLTIFKMPYATLIAVIIGVSNIIPSAIFGAIPSFIIIYLFLQYKRYGSSNNACYSTNR